jgi:hypothetical protein
MPRSETSIGWYSAKGLGWTLALFPGAG